MFIADCNIKIKESFKTKLCSSSSDQAQIWFCRLGSLRNS